MSYLESFDLRETNRLDAALVVAVKSSWGRSIPDLHISKDISEKGVFILDKTPQEIDADLRMEFALPAIGAHITRFGEEFNGWVEGRVIRVEDDGYAVQFEDEFHLAISHWPSNEAAH